MVECSDKLLPVSVFATSTFT